MSTQHFFKICAQFITSFKMKIQYMTGTNLLVLLNDSATISKLSGTSIQAFASAALLADSNLTSGALDIPFLIMLLLTPPPA